MSLGQHWEAAKRHVLTLLGIGAPKISLQVADGPHPRGMTVCGTVIVEGSGRRMCVREVLVTLADF